MTVISDLRMLSTVSPDITELSLITASVASLEFLARFPKLTSLTVTRPVYPVDWSGLRHVPELTTLLLGRPCGRLPLCNLDILSFTPKLRQLILMDALWLSDVSGLRHCPGLEVLQLYHVPQLQKLEPVKQLTELTELHVVNSPLITDDQLDWVTERSLKVLRLDQLPAAPRHDGTNIRPE